MPDRRKIPRLGVHLPITLYPAEAEPLRTESLDVSSEGFYCLVSRPFAPGVRLRFSMRLPKHVGNGSGLEVSLEGVVEVVRLVAHEATPDFAIGCRIEEYQVVRGPV